jgi:hypothetical protein
VKQLFLQAARDHTSNTTVSLTDVVRVPFLSFIYSMPC